MSDRRTPLGFWQSVALRMLVVWLIGWAAVLWFHGCLAPSVRNEMREEQQKATSRDWRDSREAR